MCLVSYIKQERNVREDKPKIKITNLSHDKTLSDSI